MKLWIWSFLYRSGGLRLYHGVRNRETLTVVLFHRVLPFDASLPRGRWPAWTVTPAFFEQCVEFFERHYAVIGLDRIHAAASGGAALPRRALLITFDDGWRDTAEVAAPLLRRRGLPCVLFAVGDIEGGAELWQEPVVRAWLAGSHPAARWRALWDKAKVVGPPPVQWSFDDLQRVLAALQELVPAERARLLGELGFDPPRPGVMMDQEAIGEFGRSSFAVGGHGMSHLPLTAVQDPERELRASSQRVREWQEGAAAPLAMSFPHGKYTADLARAALQSGYQYLFTSDAVLNRTWRGVAGRLLGRFEPSMEYFADSRGNLVPELLASVLFRLPRRRLGDAA